MYIYHNGKRPKTLTVKKVEAICQELHVKYELVDVFKLNEDDLEFLIRFVLSQRFRCFDSLTTPSKVRKSVLNELSNKNTDEAIRYFVKNPSHLSLPIVVNEEGNVFCGSYEIGKHTKLDVIGKNTYEIKRGIAIRKKKGN